MLTPCWLMKYFMNIRYNNIKCSTLWSNFPFILETVFLEENSVSFDGICKEICFIRYSCISQIPLYFFKHDFIHILHNIIICLIYHLFKHIFISDFKNSRGVFPNFYLWIVIFMTEKMFESSNFCRCNISSLVTYRPLLHLLQH